MTYFVAISSIQKSPSAIEPNNDLARETFFYESAKSALLSMSNICSFPPNSSPSEKNFTMLKDQEHMKRIQAKAEALNADRLARIDARKQRMLKKISGQVQKETLKNRTQIKRQKSTLKHEEDNEMDDEFGIEVDHDSDNAAAGSKTLYKDSKKRLNSKSAPLLKRKKTQKQNRPGKARRIQLKNRPRK